MAKRKLISLKLFVLINLVELELYSALSSISTPYIAPQTKANPLVRDCESNDVTKSCDSVYVVQKFSLEHLEKVSELLSEESIVKPGYVSDRKNRPRSFSDMINLLKAKAEFNSQLMLRYKCIQAIGNKMKDIDNCVDPETRMLIESQIDTKVMYLWQDENIRRQVCEAAGKSGDVKHGWSDTNYAITPHSDKMQHVMLVILSRNVSNEMKDNVVGFCEIAMLQSPSSGVDVECIVQPTIMNLVVCKDHRRRGLGEKLMKSARRYTQQFFYSSESKSLGLYVHEKNRVAKGLYEKLGFTFSATNTMEKHLEGDDLCHMHCDLDECILEC